MFNTLAAEKRMADIRREVRDGADQAWRATVVERWAAVELERLGDVRTRLLGYLCIPLAEAAAAGIDVKRLHAFVEVEMEKVREQTAIVDRIRRGDVAIADPVEAEAMLRMRDEALAPPKAA